MSSVKTYNNAQKFVIKKLVKIAEEATFSNREGNCDDYVLAMARKGPRTLEKLWRKDCDGCMTIKEASDKYPMLANVITEIALPFLFHKLSEEHKNIQFCIYDDAVYYGTTFLGIQEELDLYNVIYKDIQIRKQFLAGIKSLGAKRDLDYLLSDDFWYYGKEGHLEEGDEIPNGFSHFFVKKIASDIRSLHTAFEVEFPVISYEFDETVKDDVLYYALQNIFGNASVYRICHDENINYSVILANDHDALFSKMRLFADGNKLRIACISPHSLPNDIFAMERLFPNDEYGRLWQEMNNRCSFPDNVNVDNFHAYRKLERSLCKTQIILANYLLSYSFLISIKDSVENVVRSIGLGGHFVGVSERDLCYLMADKQFCKEVFDRLSYFYEERVICSALNYNTEVLPLEKISFEGVDFPLPEERMIFDEQNERMLSNSETLYESLSALFFNQKTLIEKWTEGQWNYNFNLLRFGYSLDAIVQQVKAHHDKYPLTEHTYLDVNRWIDTRIDQGSVVPQYIINPDTNRWYRVFRPGENEDALLSHLARYVLFVYRCVDSIEKLGWIERSFFEDILCLSVLNTKEKQQISKELGIRLSVSEELTGRKLDFQENEDDKLRSVLNYMLNMFILTDSDGMVTVSPRLYERELTTATTLDREVEENVCSCIRQILNEVDSYDQTHVLAYETFNKYYYNAQNWNYSDDIFTTALSMGKNLVEKIEREGTATEDLSAVYDNYFALLKYIIRSDYWNSLDSQTVKKTQEQLTAIKFLFDVIIVFFYGKSLESLDYIVQAFSRKMQNDTILSKFSGLCDYCMSFKDEQQLSVASSCKEMCHALNNSFELLRNESLS